MKIKSRRDDFVVEEILSPEIARAAQARDERHALYLLVKRGLGTPEAVERVASALGVSGRSVAFGGLKDRHALTSQYLTVDVRALRGKRPPERLAIPGVSLELVGSLPEPLSALGVAGNRFAITLRGLTRAGCRSMDDLRRFLSPPGGGGRTLAFINYYGGQRFGSARRGRGFAARCLVEGNFEGALRLLIAAPGRKTERARKTAARAIAAAWGDWSNLRRELPEGPERRVAKALAETGGDFRAGFLALPPILRQMAVEAYQSYLWNETVRRFVRDLCPPPLATASSEWGDLVFPETSRVGEETRSLAVPLLSPKTKLADPWRAAAEETLAREGIAIEELRVPGIRSPYFGDIPRRLYAEASGFSLGPPEPDETAAPARGMLRRLRFTLPRGAYATVLLAALGARDQNTLT